MAAPIGNKYALGNEGGCPRIYETPEALIAEVDSYFIYIQGEGHEERQEISDKDGNISIVQTWIWDRKPEPATVTGLALYLGFCSRQSLYDYEKNDEFSYIIKKAKMNVEHAYEKNLSGDKPTGSIFALKNMGWADRSEVDVTTNGNDIVKSATAKLPDGTILEL